MKILIVGFEGKDNSAKILIDNIKEECNQDILYLKNDFEVSSKQIEEKMLQNYDYVLIFGQKPNTENIYLENNAILEGTKLETDYYYGVLKENLESNNYNVLSSCDAGNYLCNNVFFRALNFKQKNNLKSKVGFAHIPTIDNIKDIKLLASTILDYINTLSDVFNVALLQLSPTNSTEHNIIKGIEYCKKAKEMEADIEPGTEFKTCELDYGRGKVKLGTMICFDRDFPESTRILMLQGSEIILVPNACYMSKIRLEQLKVRAYENMVCIVTVNYANHGGKSSAYSPIVRNINKHELNNELLVMDNKEDVKMVQFNMNEIREYRSRETLGDAYRKPYTYKKLIEDNVQEPFIRKDSRRN